MSSSLPKTSRASRALSRTSISIRRLSTKAREVEEIDNVLVWPVDILDSKDGEVTLIAEISEGDSGTGLDRKLIYSSLVDIEGDGHAEEDAAFEAKVLDDTWFALLAPIGTLD